MSKIIALIAMLAVGAPASVAMASSSHSIDSRNRAWRTRVERERFDHVDFPERGWNRPGTVDDFGPRRYRPTWVALSAPLQLARTSRSSIEVRDRNTFTQLRLQTTGGTAWIDRVIVQFADGTRQVADLDRTLDARGELLEIQLDGNNRRIDRIIVIGDGRRGALEVFGI